MDKCIAREERGKAAPRKAANKIVDEEKEDPRTLRPRLPTHRV